MSFPILLCLLFPILSNDDASPEVGGCDTNSQITITFGASGTYFIEATTWEYQTDEAGDCAHTLPCNYLDAWGSFTLTIAGTTATNAVTWFTPGDARIDGQPGDRIAVFCNANPNTLIVYGVEDNSRGYFLASFPNADLLMAGTKGVTKDAGPGNGTVSAMQDGAGNFYVAWNGGQFKATGVGPFSKAFACFK